MHHLLVEQSSHPWPVSREAWLAPDTAEVVECLHDATAEAAVYLSWVLPAADGGIASRVQLTSLFLELRPQPQILLDLEMMDLAAPIFTSKLGVFYIQIHLNRILWNKFVNISIEYLWIGVQSSPEGQVFAPKPWACWTRQDNTDVSRTPDTIIVGGKVECLYFTDYKFVFRNWRSAVLDEFWFTLLVCYLDA